MLGRFKDPLTIQLLVICVVSYAMGDLRAGTVVFAMIFISVFLAYFQERRSGNAAEKLKLMIHASAVVLRGGKETEVPIAEIAPGDIVALSAGSIVPADMRVIAAKDFFVAQAALTGESLPVEKDATTDSGGAGIFDMKNACFQGSTVISGTARGIAVNTGMRTFLAASPPTSRNPRESPTSTKAPRPS